MDNIYNYRTILTSFWRGLEDNNTSVEELYWYLFSPLLKELNILPCNFLIYNVNKNTLDFLKKDYTVSLVCAYEYFKTKQKRDEEPKSFEDTFEKVDLHPEGYLMKSEENIDSCAVYKLEKPGLKYPILVKFNLDDEGESFRCSVASFNYEDAKILSESIKKSCIYLPDYNKKVVFGVLVNQNSNYTVREIPFQDDNTLSMDIELNYGVQFKKHNDLILDKLNHKNHGLFIFHGNPGTGKTTYIKYLAKLYGGKRMFIFIPTNCLEGITSPSLLPVLLDHKDSVLVLEDAEKAVVSRNDQQGNESLVSNLLNIGDGILGSMLNLSVILTFNTKKDKVDEALLRKGRLLYEYEFNPLSIEDSNVILNKLNKKLTDKPMTLAEIYNTEEETGHKEKESISIGFSK